MDAILVTYYLLSNQCKYKSTFSNTFKLWNQLAVKSSRLKLCYYTFNRLKSTVEVDSFFQIGFSIRQTSEFYITRFKSLNSDLSLISLFHIWQDLLIRLIKKFFRILFFFKLTLLSLILFNLFPDLSNIFERFKKWLWMLIFWIQFIIFYFVNQS